ncbi:MAG: ABC transporter ATP-binding protein [Planctomycetota bacterium]
MELRVDSLTKVFGTLRAVDSLSFTLGQGEVCGFIGPNGAGKTTTLRMLATIEQPDGGDAWLDGHSMINDADIVRPMIGFMPDFFGSYPDMLVSEYLDFFARAYGLKGGGRRRRIADLVDFVELGPLLAKKVADLSKGMRQRISLARALVHDPDLLLLDEPAAGLDPQARRDLRELLRVLAAESKSIFISSHILSELEGLIDKVVIIDNGKLAYSGAPDAAAHEDAGDFTLTIKILGDLEDCARLLLETPAVRQVHGVAPDVLRIEMSGGKEAIAGLVEKLVAHKHVPYHVMTDGKGLEKVFLKVTGNNHDAV